MMKKTFKSAVLGVVFIFTAAYAVLAVSFTENFNTAVYKDGVNTTANWDTISGLASLHRVTKFAQTVDVINWGGGLTAIECASPSQWLLGGLQGKLNEFDGANFTDRTSNLINFGTAQIRSINYNGNYWLVGGDGPSLNRWDGAGTWIDLKNELITMSGAVNAIGSTPDGPGAYWLIGGNNSGLNAYYGTLPMMDLKSGLNFGLNRVTAIGYGGGYWLIAGTNGRIARYDGTSFTDLTGQLYTAWGNSYLDVYSLDWNGSYWLLGGGAGKIATYNGSVFTERNPGSTAFYSVWAIKWNGSYWIIGGSQGSALTVVYTTSNANITPYTLQSNPVYFSVNPVWAIGSDEQASAVNMLGGANGRLMKRTGAYNSPVNTDLSMDAVDFGSGAIACSSYNGAYWLLGGAAGALNSYDGTAFTDLKFNLGWTSETVNCAAWNPAGGYWLIGGSGGKLSKYDGVNFYDRTAALGFGFSDVKTIKWNGTGWLIGGRDRRVAAGTNGDIFAAVDISAYFGASDPVNRIEWAQGLSEWFIGGGNGSLVKYDGSAVFTDLRAALFSSLGGYYIVNAIKYDGAGRVRIGCASAKLADYQGGGFTDMSASLQNFGAADIKDMDYSAASVTWLIGGSNGKINIASGPGAGVFSDESGSLVDFNLAGINTVSTNGEYWIIAGDNTKMNRYGPAYMSPESVYSAPVDQWFAGYTCATLTASEALNGQQVAYWLSANDGATWLPADLGAGVCFSGAENTDKLRWKADLTTYDGIVSPFIDTVIINFSRVDAPTYTITPTGTITKTGTITPTGTCTGTPTVTPTITLTLTVTETFTFTHTPTATFTVTMTKTAAPTGTDTWTQTLTITVTETPTLTHTFISTGTETKTFTVTATQTETATKTFTLTSTMSITKTRTGTATGTATRTMTLTPADTVTYTFTVTATRTATITLTSTKTATATITGTRTPGAAVTATVTPGAGIVFPVTGGFILYPNPVFDTLNLSYIMSETGSVKIRIYNEAGRLEDFIEERKFTGPQVSSLNAKKLAAGVYFCLAGLSYDSGKQENSGIKKFIVLR